MNMTYLKDLDKDSREYLVQEKNYPDRDDVIVVRCLYCGEILPYKSINYNEGFHIDGC